VQEIKQAVKQAAKKLFEAEIEPEINRPDEQFGDYATNAALQLAKKAAASPRQIAEKLVQELSNLSGVQEVTIAGAGFINFKLSDEKLKQIADGAADLPKPLQGQEILVEFGDPNPFKEMHIGHLYSYIVGDAISSLLESGGAAVKRLSYHGDVGLHVAKAIWGMRQSKIQPSQTQPAESIGIYYQKGAKAYEEDQKAKAEIDEINEQIYQQPSEITDLYEYGKTESFRGFDSILQAINIKTDKRYLESESSALGIETVKQNIPRVFKHSQGAIIYEGEKAGLHTRVFITSKGLPTYETKDLGLAELKNIDYPNASRSIIITANEQAEYFKVMLAALAEINPELAGKTTHMSHGFVNLSTGKMSSRTGDVYAAGDLLSEVKTATHEQYPDSQVHKEVGIGAIKYAFTKNRLGPNIVFDVKESVSLDGNSGPYLQYAYARACSILAKAQNDTGEVNTGFDSDERRLARKISEYPEVVEKAANELMPHHVCIYLYELAQTFNSFYEKCRIIGDQREAVRLKLVKSYSQVLKSGLSLLNIAAPEKM
jgi:arginyl-tRNA synthetase